MFCFVISSSKVWVCFSVFRYFRKCQKTNQANLTNIFDKICQSHAPLNTGETRNISSARGIPQGEWGWLLRRCQCECPAGATQWRIVTISSVRNDIVNKPKSGEQRRIENCINSLRFLQNEFGFQFQFEEIWYFSSRQDARQTFSSRRQNRKQKHTKIKHMRVCACVRVCGCVCVCVALRVYLKNR